MGVIMKKDNQLYLADMQRIREWCEAQPPMAKDKIALLLRSDYKPNRELGIKMVTQPNLLAILDNDGFHERVAMFACSDDLPLHWFYTALADAGLLIKFREEDETDPFYGGKDCFCLPYQWIDAPDGSKPWRIE